MWQKCSGLFLFIALAQGEPDGEWKKFFKDTVNLTLAVKEVDTQNSVLSYRGAVHTVPASTAKLFTAAAALHILGPDSAFSTEFGYAGALQDGLLLGDLVIKGDGDPAFGSRFFGSPHQPKAIFGEWASALKKKGVTRISGCVQVWSGFTDDSQPNRYALYEDIGNYFAGTTSGLCYRDNYYELLLQGSLVAGIPIVVLGTEPRHTGILTFDNDLVTGPRGSADEAYILGAPYSSRRNLRGTYPAGKREIRIKGSLPYPAYTCARDFAAYLEKEAGLVFENSECYLFPAQVGIPPVQAKQVTPLASHTSPPVKSLVNHTLLRSDNNYADQLLVLIGRASKRAPSRKAGLEALRNFLAELKLPGRNFNLVDGSGLSRVNYVSAEFFTDFLAAMASRKNFQIFKEALSGGAADKGASLKAFGLPGAEKLWIKTGYLENTSTFAGYFTGKSGKLYSFYFSLNNSPRPAGLKKQFGQALKKIGEGL